MVLVIWLAVQVCALAVSAARIRLWASAPQASEQLALAVLLAAQIGSASLLMPRLLASGRSTLIAIVTAWPLGELASFLADQPLARFIAAQAYVSVCLLGLYCWTRVIRRPTAQLYASALAIMASAGGAVLWYLHLEFATGVGGMQWSSASLFGPVLGAISLLCPGNVTWRPWVIPGGILASALICVFVRGRLAAPSTPIHPHATGR